MPDVIIWVEPGNDCKLKNFKIYHATKKHYEKLEGTFETYQDFRAHVMEYCKTDTSHYWIKIDFKSKILRYNRGTREKIAEIDFEEIQRL